MFDRVLLVAVSLVFIPIVLWIAYLVVGGTFFFIGFFWVVTHTPGCCGDWPGR
jgi:hypothetical protein